MNVAIGSGLNAIGQVNGGKLLSYHIITRPHENLEYALPIYHSANVDNFSAEIGFPPPLSA